MRELRKFWQRFTFILKDRFREGWVARGNTASSAPSLPHDVPEDSDGC